MSLSKNLAYSRSACEYVLKTSGLDGANWDQYRGSAQSYEACRTTGTHSDCAAFMTTTDRCLYLQVRPTVDQLTAQRRASMLEQIRIRAGEARANKCGNCGEFSALAFIFLYDLGVRPLDWMSLVDGDHAFVVIGRRAGNPDDVKSWGSDAVVCDPWAEGFRHNDPQSGTYPGTMFDTQMRTLTSFTDIDSMHREE